MTILPNDLVLPVAYFAATAVALGTAVACAIYLLKRLSGAKCPFQRKAQVKLSPAARLIGHPLSSTMKHNHKATPATDRPAAPPMDRPVSQNSPDNTAFLQDLQGNILNGHGRDHASHILVRFKAGSSQAARKWIAEFSSKYVSSAYEQLHASRKFKLHGHNAGIFGHIAISGSGYTALGIESAKQPHGLNPRGHEDGKGYAEVFRKGMKSRQMELTDPQAEQWEAAYQGDIHMLLILACDTSADLDLVQAEVVQSLSEIADSVSVERGMGLTRQLDPQDKSTVVHVEHFGFVDGRSQPLVLVEQIAEEKAKGGIDKWDPSAPLNLLLAPDPLGEAGFSHGSFLVYRKLEQNVRGFNTAMQALAAALGVPEDLARAMAMGRFQDGTPVSLQGTAGTTDTPNNFSFDDDPEGLKCPLQAHIRKSNPRRGLDTKEHDSRHRIARRGIPYGGELTTTSDLAEMPESGKGLLFFCYQADIFEQFEFIQRTWSNFAQFPKPGTGLDPVIGQAANPHSGSEAAKRWPSGWGKPLVCPGLNIAGFVKLKGGEYFFSPSLSFLRNLSNY